MYYTTGSSFEYRRDLRHFSALTLVSAMFTRLLTVRTLMCLVRMFNMSESKRTCDKGWFGEGCLFKCNCESDVVCAADGTCPGRCYHGNFGPACQYEDLALNSIEAPDYLTDGREGSCNQDRNATSVHMAWEGEGIRFTWLRLHVMNARGLVDFQIILNENLPCPNFRNFSLSATAVDVTCDFLSKVNRLEVTGTAAMFACSLYISGGRNVALRQQTNQTGSYSDEYNSSASLAVDSKQWFHFDSRSRCSRTDPNQYRPAWTLTFNRPHVIVTIKINSPIDKLHWMYGSRLHAFGVNGRVVYTYPITDRVPQLTYYIYPEPRIPIVSLEIFRTEYDKQNEKVISLCELETLGEAVCPDGYFGLWCHRQCTCPDLATCFLVTGACALGCPGGKYGFNCSLLCPHNCKYHLCYQRHGTCEDCNPGYTGTICDRPCNHGFYGEMCSQACSPYCKNTCNIKDGSCECIPPFTGKTCSECPVSFYGDNCSESCPSRCVGSRCHVEDGSCLLCPDDRIGPSCEECPDGFYGDYCSSKCSKFCPNRTCDVNTGTCGPCTMGYSGAECNIGPQTISLLLLVTATVASVLVSLICLCFFIQRISNKWYDNEEDSQISHSSSQ